MHDSTDIPVAEIPAKVIVAALNFNLCNLQQQMTKIDNPKKLIQSESHLS